LGAAPRNRAWNSVCRCRDYDGSEGGKKNGSKAVSIWGKNDCSIAHRGKKGELVGAQKGEKGSVEEKNERKQFKVRDPCLVPGKGGGDTKGSGMSRYHQGDIDAGGVGVWSKGSTSKKTPCGKKDNLV